MALRGSRGARRARIVRRARWIRDRLRPRRRRRGVGDRARRRRRGGALSAGRPSALRRRGGAARGARASGRARRRTDAGCLRSRDADRCPGALHARGRHRGRQRGLGAGIDRTGRERREHRLRRQRHHHAHPRGAHPAAALRPLGLRDGPRSRDEPDGRLPGHRAPAARGGACRHGGPHPARRRVLRHRLPAAGQQHGQRVPGVQRDGAGVPVDADLRARAGPQHGLLPLARRWRRLHDGRAVPVLRRSSLQRRKRHAVAHRDGIRARLANRSVQQPRGALRRQADRAAPHRRERGAEQRSHHQRDVGIDLQLSVLRNDRLGGLRCRWNRGRP